nr:hypothetical protein OG999_09385 [Streptomyces sp. NBC_00886]
MPADLDGETWLRYANPGPDDVPIRSIEEKFEAVATGAGITPVPVPVSVSVSVSEQYSRPDITYVPVTDAEPDEVILAREASRLSPLIAAFVTAAQG